MLFQMSIILINNWFHQSFLKRKTFFYGHVINRGEKSSQKGTDFDWEDFFVTVSLHSWILDGKGYSQQNNHCCEPFLIIKYVCTKYPLLQHVFTRRLYEGLYLGPIRD